MTKRFPSARAGTFQRKTRWVSRGFSRTISGASRLVQWIRWSYQA